MHITQTLYLKNRILAAIDDTLETSNKKEKKSQYENVAATAAHLISSFEGTAGKVHSSAIVKPFDLDQICRQALYNVEKSIEQQCTRIMTQMMTGRY